MSDKRNLPPIRKMSEEAFLEQARRDSAAIQGTSFVSSRNSRLDPYRKAETEVMMDSPPPDFILHSYVLRIYRCQCLDCGEVSVHSEAFELYASARNPGARRLAPAKYIAPERDIALEDMPVTQTRKCHFCIATSAKVPTSEELRLFIRKMQAGSAWDEKAKRAALTREQTQEKKEVKKAAKMEDLL